MKGYLNIKIIYKYDLMDFDAPTLGGAVKAVLLPYLHTYLRTYLHKISKKNNN